MGIMRSGFEINMSKPTLVPKIDTLRPLGIFDAASVDADLKDV